MGESQESLYSLSSNDFMELDRFDTSELKLLSSQNSELEIDSQTLVNNLFSHEGYAQSYTDIIDIPPVHNLEHLRQLPTLEDMSENDWMFDMQLKSESGNKTSWLYSASLNKVFVKINTPLNVYPAFIRQNINSDLYIRAMIVYSSQNDLPEPVKKCPNHKEKSNDCHADHILRCDNSGSIYSGIENGKVFEEKLAVIVPMKSIASNEPLKLTFTCQNSCSGGMNRKSTSLVFTLEDQFQNVLGRKCMHFKVCSCPRRDKEKDEQTTKALPKKRKNEGSNAPSTSKKQHLMQKQDSTETLMMDSQSPIDSPFETIQGTFMNIKQEQDAQVELKILLPNDAIKKKALDAVYNVIAGEMSRSGNSAYMHYLTELQKQIDDNEML
ncbi:cellular tumor antigen p53 [Chironomus tepperi]|uniref:cellular tumor antigen p53 n=1 Tax=Chironomus tepperi TaxID=113505 RepID=UPI00391F2787